MTIDKDTVERLAFKVGGIGLYQPNAIKWSDGISMIAFTDETLSQFAQAIIAEYVGSGEAVGYTNQDSIDCLKNNQDQTGMFCRLKNQYADANIPLFTHPKQDDLQAKLDEYKRLLEQAKEAIEVLNKGKPLGELVGLHTAQNALVSNEKLKAENKRLREALEGAKSVINSINRGKNNMVVNNDEIMFTQREEWVNWAANEILPNIEQALSTINKE